MDVTADKGGPEAVGKSFLRENCASGGGCVPSAGELLQWPVKIGFVPLSAPYYYNADLLVAADCCAYARAGFHREFIRGHITLIGCPQADAAVFYEKLTEILRGSDIRSLTVARMEDPCCAELESAVKRAVKDSGRVVPCRTVTLTDDGRVAE